MVLQKSIRREVSLQTPHCETSCEGLEEKLIATGCCRSPYTVGTRGRRSCVPLPSERLGRASTLKSGKKLFYLPCPSFSFCRQFFTSGSYVMALESVPERRQAINKCVDGKQQIDKWRKHHVARNKRLLLDLFYCRLLGCFLDENL